MKDTRIIMGMTINVEIVDAQVTKSVLDQIFDYFSWVNEKFSFFKKDNEIGRLNEGTLTPEQYSSDLIEILALAEKTKQDTDGYFDIVNREGKINPSGIVKGWAIQKAAEILWRSGYNNFFVDAGGDIQTSGKNALGENWEIGIRNPFKPETEIVKVLSLSGEGVATSGNYARGNHVYNPHDMKAELNDIISLTVIGPNIYEADRFATAVFAMGREGIDFISQRSEFEAYAIDHTGQAIMTSNFNKYVKNN